MKWIIGLLAAMVALVGDMGLFMPVINITHHQEKKKKVPKKEKTRDLQKRKVKRKIASRRKNG